MRRDEFRYELPAELIAQQPLRERAASRLLHLDLARNALVDRRFSDLPDLLREGDLLVFNDTRVIPARLYGKKTTGGRVEVLIERVIGDSRAVAHVRASRAPAMGAALDLEDGVTARIVGRDGDLFELVFEDVRSVAQILEAAGHVPLPPYIERPDTEQDRQRYQTIFARRAGAVAAPTAGLHFDEHILERIRAHGVSIAWVTLHVGAGTFQPVRTERVEEHHMHSEHIEVSELACEQAAQARRRGGRIVAVGTTVVRSLETASRGGTLQPFKGDTDIFIYPGYEFRTVDALLTNFHLPESTLLMLVCAFAGHERTMAAYRHAVTQRYRFFSYGDAMFISKI